MKGVFIVLSGVADEPCQALGQITPLQAAKTPNLDVLSRKSRIDYCYPVKEGVVPYTSDSLISMFGENPNFASRAALEAQGFGINFKRGDLILRTNFSTIDGLEEGSILDRRAGRTLTTKEIKTLSKEINQKVKLPFKFEFVPTLHHRGLLVVRGGFSDNITNADPFYSKNGNVNSARNEMKVSFSKPLDDEEDSKLSADLVNSFVRQSHDILDKHHMNSSRAQKGFFSANFLLCRDAGNQPVKFKKLKGRWMALGYTALDKGLAEAFKMERYDMKYPAAKSVDIYSNLYNGLNRAVKSSVKMLKKNRKNQDYFYINLKETDAPGMDNKPFDKVKMIEMIDKKLFGFLKGFASKYGVKVVVAVDHVTSSRLKGITADPVPILYFDPQNQRDDEKRFTEEQALKGKKILGKKLLENTLFKK